MSKGWKGDSARHSLAAKGCKTRRSIPHKSAQLDETAFKAGTQLAMASERFKNYIIYEENLRGLVSDMEVPHSELAMHSGAAGGKVVALVGRMKDGILREVLVTYKKKDKYGWVSGGPNEVLASSTADLIEKMYGGGRL